MIEIWCQNLVHPAYFATKNRTWVLDKENIVNIIEQKKIGNNDFRKEFLRFLAKPPNSSIDGSGFFQ